MKIKHEFRSFLTAFMLTGGVLVGEAIAQVPIKGVGTETCQASLKSGAIARENLTWVIGYLSGLSNLHAGDDAYRGRFRQLSVEDIRAHVEQFCRGKPAALFADAADDLYKTIVPK